MRKIDAELSVEARAALRKEWLDGFFRSLLISFGFSAPAALTQSVSPKLLVWVAFGLPLGIAIPLIKSDLFVRFRHRTFLVTLARRSLLYGLTFYVGLSISLLLMFAFAYDPKLRAHCIEVWLGVIADWRFVAGMAGAVALTVPVSFMFALSRKLGPGVLWKWTWGYYHEPRQEERIFMFLDMKDSTMLAERLGELKFSALVRDFFQDMTLPVLQTKAEVSHYIGDEAVLTWTMKDGIERANCIRIFFEFEKAIQRRATYYREHYGLVPEFKAGVHSGTVVATEVGEVKSEIVYHGDVLNTAARIQGLCNSTGERLLVSIGLARHLGSIRDCEMRDLGGFEVKGKEEKVHVVVFSTKRASGYIRHNGSK
jgi:adenylate cyclase